MGYLGIIAESDLVHPTSIKISRRVKKRFASAMSCSSFLRLELGSIDVRKGKKVYIFSYLPPPYSGATLPTNSVVM